MHIFDIEAINEGLEVAIRQKELQDYEGLFIKATVVFDRFGFDFKFNRDLHAAVKIIAINDMDVKEPPHIWVRNIAFEDMRIYNFLQKGDVLEFYGQVYPYYSGTKKYSIHLRSLFNLRNGYSQWFNIIWN